MKNFIIYLVCAAIFLAVQMFQGFSYLDIGMYLSGCEWFSESPLTIYYLCNWLMTFRVTSLLLNVFSLDSFMALRIFHLVYVLCMQVAAFLYCRKYIPERMIILGLALATLAHFGSYTEINYNDYTIGILTAAVLVYHKAVERSSGILLSVSGMVIAVSFFFRVVNISFVMLPLWFGVYGLYAKSMGLRQIFRQYCWFGAGMTVGVVLMLCMIYLDGMWQPFSLLVSDIFVMCGDSSDPHSLYNVAVSFFYLHRNEVKTISAALLIFFVISWVNTRCPGRKRWIANVLLGLVLAYNMNFMEPPSNYTIGLCILAFLLVLTVSKVPEEVKRLYVLTFFIPFLMPLGSNAEPEFYGKDLCFFTLPIALHVLYVEISRYKACHTSAVICYSALCAGLLYVNLTHPMMEETNRRSCLYSIDSPKVRNIFTGKENADVHNKLLRELKPMIGEGCYMYCDFSLPAVALLDCKPYAVFSTIFTSDIMNRRYIDVAFKNTSKLPLMLLTKNNKDSKVKFVVECFKQKSSYRVLWEDDTHVLLTPLDYPCR